MQQVPARDEAWAITFDELRTYRRLELFVMASFVVPWLVTSVFRFIIRWDRMHESPAAWLVVLPFLTLTAAALAADRRRKRLRSAVNERFAVEFMLRTRSEFPIGLNVLDVKKQVPGFHNDGTVTIWQLKRKGATFHLRRT
jgi:hypothetical protein